jgi:hypothetical protein
MRDEITRRDEPFLRVPPSDESLASHELTGHGTDLRLIMELEFVRGNRAAQIAEYGEAVAVVAVVTLEIDADGDSGLLRAIECQVCAL